MSVSKNHKRSFFALDQNKKLPEGEFKNSKNVKADSPNAEAIGYQNTSSLQSQRLLLPQYEVG